MEEAAFLVTVVAAFSRRPVIVAALVYLVSLGTMVAFAVLGDIPPTWLTGEVSVHWWHYAVPGGSEHIWPSHSPAELWFLAPVCVFGFVLCPYLDVTFHRAHQETAPRTKAPFSLGFGVLFLVMVLFTLWYAPLFNDLHGARRITLMLVASHMIVQLAFTVGVHARGLWTTLFNRNSRRLWAAAFVLACVVTLFTCPIVGIDRSMAYGRLFMQDDGELLYRLFMSFYGLIFPAYVYLCMIPTRDRRSGPSRDKVITWLAACALASPCYWMGFIERQTWWLLPGVAIVLLARVPLMLTARRTKPNTAGAKSP